MTLQDRLAETDYRSSGFDYLRIILSVSVIAWHTLLVCYGKAGETPFWTGALRPIPYIIVPAFFSLSGFLVAGSLERNDLRSFLILRGIRIFPALVVEVVISALIIGPLLTTLPLHDYFSKRLFWSYFLNVLGWIHYVLPGVFDGLPAGSTVNQQLWTVPYELECYLSISAISLIGLYKRPKALFGILCATTLIVVAGQAASDSWSRLDYHPPGRMIVLCFMLGVALYGLRGQIPLSKSLFIVSLILAWVFMEFRETAFLVPLPVTYVTVYLGLQSPRRLFFLLGADYSYGLYLYGFPIQQTLVYLFPGSRVWWINLLATAFVASIAAMLSWHLVESRVLSRKRHILSAAAKLTFRSAPVATRDLGGHSK